MENKYEKTHNVSRAVRDELGREGNGGYIEGVGCDRRRRHNNVGVCGGGCTRLIIMRVCYSVV
jgi:hypothetical protein